MSLRGDLVILDVLETVYQKSAYGLAAAPPRIPDACVTLFLDCQLNVELILSNSITK